MLKVRCRAAGPEAKLSVAYLRRGTTSHLQNEACTCVHVDLAHLENSISGVNDIEIPHDKKQ